MLHAISLAIVIAYDMAHFSRKLTLTQGRYSTIEQKMLAIVEVLNEYRKLLLGANIVIFTDHNPMLLWKDSTRH